ncbi:MAG: diguanylate cyclase [Acetobacterium sp.]|nr:diguanylate cyclase [Acetobacterium sp.]
MEEFFATNSQQQILNRIFSLNLGLLCILNIDGWFETVNNSWEKTFGYSAEELSNTNIIDYAHPDDRDATAFVFSELLHANHRLTFSNRFRSKDGTYRYIDWEFNRHDNYAYVAGTDITHTKLSVAGLKAVKKHLENNHSHCSDKNLCPTRQKILVVDDSPLNTKIMENALIEDYEVLISHNGKEALSICNSNDPPDLILLDVIMPEIDGYEICRRLNRSEKTKDIPVIFLTSLTESKDIEFGLTLGAIDYITKPFSVPIIKAKIKNHLALKYYQDTLKINTDVDQLTQIANRRRFDDTMTKEIKKAKRTGTILSVLLLDIDHFKFYNDTYGHLEGDACLKKVATTLATTLKRPRDLAARWGGEEFTCLLPNTNTEGAQNVAEALLKAIQNLSIPHESSPVNDVVTVSIGVISSNPIDENSFENLLKHADEALYQAKETGRNRIVAWHEKIEAIEPYL